MFRRNLCPSCRRSEHGGNRVNACVCKCHTKIPYQVENRDKNNGLDKFIEKTDKELRDELHKPVEKK